MRILPIIFTLLMFSNPVGAQGLGPGDNLDFLTAKEEGELGRLEACRLTIDSFSRCYSEKKVLSRCSLEFVKKVCHFKTEVGKGTCEESVKQEKKAGPKSSVDKGSASAAPAPGDYNLAVPPQPKTAITRTVYRYDEDRYEVVCTHEKRMIAVENTPEHTIREIVQRAFTGMETQSEEGWFLLRATQVYYPSRRGMEGEDIGVLWLEFISREYVWGRHDSYSRACPSL